MEEEREREELQHKQNVWPSANIYWLNRTHVPRALTKRYLRSYGNLTIDSSKSLNYSHPSIVPIVQLASIKRHVRSEGIFGVTILSKPQFMHNYHQIWKMKNYSFLKKFQTIL